MRSRAFLGVLLGALLIWGAAGWGGGMCTRRASAVLEHEPSEEKTVALVSEASAARSARAEVEATAPPDSLLQDGAISGVVLDAEGSPVSGASCRIAKGSSPVGVWSKLVPKPWEESPVFARVRSDSRGRFRIEVPEGYWALEVERKGFRPWREEELQAGDYRTVRLDPGGEVVLVAVDTDGDPIAGARVCLLKGEFDQPLRARSRTVTDGSGVARLRAIPSGVWYAHVSHADFISRVRELPAPAETGVRFVVVLERGVGVFGRVRLGDGGAPPLGARVLFETPDGTRSSHEVEIGPGGAYASRRAFEEGQTIEVAALVPGYGESRKEVDLDGGGSSGRVRVDLLVDSPERFVSGRVVDPHGRGLSGVEVCVKPLLDLPEIQPIPIPSDLEILIRGLPDLDIYDPVSSFVARYRLVARTGEEGWFHAGGLQADRPYNLLLVSDRFSNASLWLPPGLPGETADVGTVTLAPGGRVWGYVRYPDGRPVEGANVHTAAYSHVDLTGKKEYLPQRSRVVQAPLETVTNGEGRFVFEPFPESEFYLMCEAVQFGPYSLSVGTTLGPLELVIEGRLSELPREAAILGLTVQDGIGHPVPQAFASARFLDPESEEADAFVFHQWSYGRGDSAGRVELEVRRPGTYRVEVVDLQGLLDRRDLVLDVPAEGVDREVSLEEVSTPPQVLEGRVVSAFGDPLPGMQVTLIPVTGDVSCKCIKIPLTTDASGAFSFGFFMEGQHELLVTDPDGRLPAVRVSPARPGKPISVVME